MFELNSSYRLHSSCPSLRYGAVDPCPDYGAHPAHWHTPSATLRHLCPFRVEFHFPVAAKEVLICPKPSVWDASGLQALCLTPTLG